MLDEKQIPETVFKMASSTFVAEVEASTLAIMAPRLDEGSPYFHAAAPLVSSAKPLVSLRTFASS